MPALDAEISHQVLGNHGVDNACARSAISTWACGLPLALVLGAAAWVEHGAAAIQPGGAVLAATADDLVGHLSGLALDQLDTELLEVAAVAGWLDDRLLADVLPDREATSALATLASYSFVERSGAGVRCTRWWRTPWLNGSGTTAGGSRTWCCGSRRTCGTGRSSATPGRCTSSPPSPRTRSSAPGWRPRTARRCTATTCAPARTTRSCAGLPQGMADAVRPWLQPQPASSWRTPTQVVRHTDGRVVAAAVALPLGEAAALVRGEDPRAELVAPLARLRRPQRHGRPGRDQPVPADGAGRGRGGPQRDGAAQRPHAAPLPGAQSAIRPRQRVRLVRLRTRGRRRLRLRGGARAAPRGRRARGPDLARRRRPVRPGRPALPRGRRASTASTLPDPQTRGELVLARARRLPRRRGARGTPLRTARATTSGTRPTRSGRGYAAP